jgi:imidazolonepropionase-like amidohydrolase
MNQKRKILAVFVVVGLISWISWGAGTNDEKTFLIPGAKIFTSGANGIIKDGALLVEGGKIIKVLTGENLPSVPIHEYPGCSIIPGIVDAHTYVSGYLRILENTRAITSDLVAYPAFNPLSPEIQQAIESGITAVNFSPRNENLVGGISSIFKLTSKVEPLSFLKKEAFLKISFNKESQKENRAPTSLMGAPVILSENLDQTKSGIQGREDIFVQRGLQKMAQGTVFPMIAASRYEEIQTGLEWLEKEGLKGIIVGGEEAFHFLKNLQKQDVAVLHSPLWFSVPNKVIQNAAALAKSGIPFGFVSFMPEGDPLSLRLSALMLFHQGISQEEALKTITIHPARILGIDDRVGAIEAGKDADLVILSGDPLDLSSQVKAVYIDGRLVYKRNGSS